MTLIRHYILTLRLRLNAPWPSERRTNFLRLRSV